MCSFLQGKGAAKKNLKDTADANVRQKNKKEHKIQKSQHFHHRNVCIGIPPAVFSESNQDVSDALQKMICSLDQTSLLQWMV